MSGRCVSRVLESDLAPDLKFTAVVFASFADDDGRHIRPAIGLVAYLRGLEERRVQVHVKELRRMEILGVVRPATQWLPTHYEMRFDKLPGRAPYKPPDRQRSFFRGESPPPEQSGVQPAAPLSGVHSTVPGVQPTTPDPSVRSVSTHTYARASADTDLSEKAGGESPIAEVQPTAPLTDPSLPLIVAPSRDPDHDAHAWCGRICVPKFLHKQFKNALGGPVKFRPKRMRTFYAETLAAIPSAHPIGEEPVKFWRRAFAGRFGAVPIQRRDGGIRGSRCSHEPRCVDYKTCIERVVADGQAERARQSG